MLQPKGALAFPWLAAFTPGALFILMSLFWYLDMPRYVVYCPLYLAGKGLGITATLFWFFFTGNEIIRELIVNDMALRIIPGIAVFMVLGDLLSLWVVYRLMEKHR